jgi:hypothetical protein
MGNFGRAARTCLQNAPAPVNARNVTKLAALHPPASAALPPLPRQPDGTPSPERAAIDLDRLRRIVRSRLANGSAPGPSGWTGELIRSLIDDEICGPGINAIVLDMINGRIDEGPRLLLLSSRLIGILKPNLIDLRPIAVGEAFYRLTALTALDQFSTDDIFALSEQYGVGRPGGSERALHAIRSALDLRGPDSVVLTLDIKNAFNSRRRSEIAQALFAEREASPAWRLFHWAYRSATPLLIYDRSGHRHATLL